MDTLEGNKLIAEFMGFQSEMRVGGKRWLINHYWVLLEKMQYHSSWEWLMEVVKKIGRLYDEFHLEKRPICDLTIFTPIDMVYTWVLDFIEWYNRHQPVNKK